MSAEAEFHITIETVEPQPVGVIATRARLDELSSVVPALCGEAWQAAKGHSEVQLPCALMVAIYCAEGNEASQEDGRISLHVGLQMAASFEGDERFQSSSTPGGLVAHTTLLGPYGRLGEAPKAITAFCAQHGHAFRGPNWEVYGHWTEDDSRLRTDVFYALV